MEASEDEIILPFNHHTTTLSQPHPFSCLIVHPDHPIVLASNHRPSYPRCLSYAHHTAGTPYTTITGETHIPWTNPNILPALLPSNQPPPSRPSTPTTKTRPQTSVPFLTLTRPHLSSSPHLARGVGECGEGVWVVCLGILCCCNIDTEVFLYADRILAYCLSPHLAYGVGECRGMPGGGFGFSGGLMERGVFIRGLHGWSSPHLVYGEGNAGEGVGWVGEFDRASVVLVVV